MVLGKKEGKKESAAQKAVVAGRSKYTKMGWDEKGNKKEWIRENLEQ